MYEVGVEDLLEEQVAFYAIIRGELATDRVAYIRHLNPMQVIKPGRRFFEFGDTLKNIEKPVFVVDDQVDLIMRPDGVVVLNADFFQALFFRLSGADEHMASRVRNMLAKLPATKETLEMLTELARSRVRFRGKVAKIERSGHLVKYNIGDYEAALKKRGLPKREFMKDNKIFAAEKDGEVLLAVLNQDIFEGCFDGIRRIAGSKRET